MNILQILPELKSGGVERGTVDLAKYLNEKGHKSVVVSAGGPLAADLVTAGVTHYTLPVHRKSPLAAWRSVRALSRIVKREGIQLIHARSRVPAVIAFFTSLRTDVPFVTTCHGFYGRHLFSRVMGWGKLVIVASRIIGKRMRDDFGVPCDKIRLIPRGVSLAEFPYRPHAPVRGGGTVIGLIGRLTPIKGHALFLKAMARVTRVLPNVKVQIIGDAPRPQYKEELLTLTRRLGLAHAVEFLGTRYDIPELLDRMTVLAVPSVGEEAFGRVAIEAGARGVPVVATRVGGLIDVIEHEKDGLLVPPDDPALLAEAIIRVIRQPELGARLAAVMRQKVEREFHLERMFEKTLQVYEEALRKKKILVIKLSALGDVILSIPSLRAIREAEPEAWITVLVGRKSRKIVRNCPYVNDVIVYDEAGSLRGPWASFFQTAVLLARENFDAVVDLQNNKKSGLLAFLSGARRRAGHGGRKWSFLLTDRTRLPSALSPLDHQFEVLKLLGIRHFDKRLDFWTNAAEEAKVEAFLRSQWVSPEQTLIGIHPGSSLRWPTKHWAPENFARLCDELAKRNLRVVLTGAAEDARTAERIIALTRNRPINAVGRTSITELGALIRRCRVFVSSDSAPMHVAAALDVPLVALFGPTDPRRHLVPPSHVEVFWKELACTPCYLRHCPIGHTCMKKITVQEVLDAVLRLARTAPEPAVGKQVAAAVT
ncbi:MAG: lipopolysaccharide heptosyltransferase II [Omnitrophica bacterium RIFCSPHIGHO2_02_FULL_63_14]|nr:MAG: lipopolysaccharide heptosyltransferase II [Omnitrophica bacterium RIFCSPHIGHO2_02_FULL_63_14]